MHDLSNLAAELLVSVLALLGQPSLDAPPIVAVEPAYLQQRVCGRSCRVYAWYAPEGTIYLDKRLDLETDIMAKSVLVHELVHHVQRARAGAPAANCLDWSNREHEAYAIQLAWLRRHDVYPNRNWLHARRVQCLAKAE